MAKKNTPIITHKEIICRAIRSIEEEIETMQKRCEGKTSDPFVKQLLVTYVSERTPKLDALKTMYYYETGTEY